MPPFHLPDASSLSLGQCATLACLLEVAAPKPGNVHRGADFEDLSLEHFLASATAIGPAIDAAESGLPLGEAVLQAIRATREVAKTNTNLGTVLLIAPLAKVPRGVRLQDGIGQILASLTRPDARHVYEAIRIAAPGGLGRVEEHDIAAGPPPDDLLAAMRSAADRDLVARQYVENFHHVLDLAVPWLRDALVRLTVPQAIVHVQMRLMAEFPDSLIARKCGPETARRASLHAASVLAMGMPDDEPYQDALADFDFWLRSDGHRRNPGTTADLLAAALFTLLREDRAG